MDIVYRSLATAITSGKVFGLSLVHHSMTVQFLLNHKWNRNFIASKPCKGKQWQTWRSFLVDIAWWINARWCDWSERVVNWLVGRVGWKARDSYWLTGGGEKSFELRQLAQRCKSHKYSYLWGIRGRLWSLWVNYLPGRFWTPEIPQFEHTASVRILVHGCGSACNLSLLGKPGQMDCTLVQWSTKKPNNCSSAGVQPIHWVIGFVRSVYILLNYPYLTNKWTTGTQLNFQKYPVGRELTQYQSR